MGKKVLPISTNIREFIDLFVDWGSLGHGACLASVGLTLQNVFHKIYIAASHTYANLPVWGTHPLLDPLWSVENLSFIHDGLEASRLDKICFIAKSPIALKTLRVCYKLNNNLQSAQLNCGRCEKCLRTMISLHITGALSKCEVFPNSINLDLTRNMSISPLATYVYKELYNVLGSSKQDEEIKTALKDAFTKAGIDSNVLKQEEKAESTYLLQQIHNLNQELSAILSPAETIIFIDENQLGKENIDACQAIPFVENDGKYWGPPANDETAIKEIQRLQKNGASYVVVAWPAFWWLEYYNGFAQYLRSGFPCILENDCLIVFNLKNKQAA